MGYQAVSLSIGGLCYGKIGRLVRQYAGLRLGGTDASVVAICERLGIVTVATMNLRDFAAVRPRHIPAFITVPGLG
jgi:hypothetical protein